MSYEEVKEILEKQLQLLSQRSQKCKSNKRLTELTSAMSEIIQRLWEWR